MNYHGLSNLHKIIDTSTSSLIGERRKQYVSIFLNWEYFHSYHIKLKIGIIDLGNIGENAGRLFLMLDTK